MSQLLRSQRNDLYKAIEQAGLTPSEFEIFEPEFGVSTEKVAYRGTATEEEFYFEIEVRGFRCSWSPARQSKHDADMFQEWSSVVEVFSRWLQYLRRELDAPDLWADLSQLTALATASAEDDLDGEEPLSPGEQEKLMRGLDQVRELVASRADLPEDQKQAMSDAVDKIQTSSRRIGRNELFSMVVGAVVNQVIRTVLTVENAKWLMTKILIALGALHVLGEHVFNALSH